MGVNVVPLHRSWPGAGTAEGYAASRDDSASTPSALVCPPLPCSSPCHTPPVRVPNLQFEVLLFGMITPPVATRVDQKSLLTKATFWANMASYDMSGYDL